MEEGDNEHVFRVEERSKIEEIGGEEREREKVEERKEKGEDQ